MGRLFLENLDGDKVYSCKRCCTHLVDKKELVSKNFHGKTGRAFLFNSAVNVDFGPEKDKIMMTGLHTIKSVICKKCRQVIGWTYVFAYEQREKYKEGKFIIEKEYMLKHKVPELPDDTIEDEEEMKMEGISGEPNTEEKDE
jgi:RNase P subunit RPR2